MDPQKKFNNRILLNHSDLRKLLNKPDSCVKVKTCEYNITLHPFHLSNIVNSVKEILNSGITKYHHDFGGILLGYENIKLFDYKAPMFDDMCYMHQKIEANFYLFHPTVGCMLNGIINKKSPDHVGCLVHQLFNISLPKPADSQDWLGFKVQIGQEVKFQVSYMQLDARLPYLRGELIAIISEDSGISTSEETTVCNNRITKFSDEADDEPLSAELQKNQKKKKKKKSKEADQVQIDCKETIPKKKKRSKKEKESIEINNNSKLMEELQHQYQDQLSILKEMAASEDEDIPVQLKKKIKKKKRSKEIKQEDNIIPDKSQLTHKNHGTVTFCDFEHKSLEIKKTKRKSKVTKERNPEKAQIPTNHEDLDGIGNEIGIAYLKHKKSKKRKKAKESNDGTNNISRRNFAHKDNELEIDYQKHKKNSNNKAKETDIQLDERKIKKKKKDKTANKERDLLDETLPDLNLDVLFEDGSLSQLGGTEIESTFSQDIVLPNDSDMDEVLKDLPKIKKKSKKAKKRKLDATGAEAIEALCKKKKERKST